MGRMHGDAQFAGSSSVPAHVEMMGLIGMGNNPRLRYSCLRCCSLQRNEIILPFGKYYTPSFARGVFVGDSIRNVPNNKRLKASDFSVVFFVCVAPSFYVNRPVFIPVCYCNNSYNMLE